MAISIFDTRTMLRTLEIMFPPKTFLRDLFFREQEAHTTETVDIDIVKGKRRLAPYVRPTAQGKIVEREGYTTKTFKPPYIKPKMVTTATGLLKRQPGNVIYQGNSNPAQRAAEQVGKDLKKMRDMIIRREEEQASQALNTGKILVVGEGINAEVDFLMDASHLVTLSGNALWTDTVNSNPIQDIRGWARTIAKDSGHSATDIVFGESVMDAFLDHPKVKEYYDKRRIVIGEIRSEAITKGAKLWGQVEGINIWSYDEWYLDSSDVLQPMVPADKIFFGSTEARAAKHYGAIQDLEATAAVPFFPKSWIEKDPSVRYIMVQSAPLLVPHEIDSFMAIKAV